MRYADIDEFVKVDSYEDIERLGYHVPKEWKEQLDIVLDESSNLVFHTRINKRTKGVHVGMLNKLVAFVE